MDAVTCCEAPISYDFRKKNRLKKLFACTLVLSVFVVTSCSFVAIGLISTALGLLNSMGVFGDGKLSEIIGYASIIGSVVGFAGNMMYPGGGIGPGYGKDGFGIGYSTDTYQAAMGDMSQYANGTNISGEEASNLLNNDGIKQGTLDDWIRANPDSVGNLQGQYQAEEALQNSINKNNTIIDSLPNDAFGPAPGGTELQLYDEVPMGYAVT